MKKLTEGIIRFLHAQPYTIVTTIDKNGCPHNSCKGIVDIKKDGRVYLLDLYKKETYENLKHNSHVNITAVDEHKFMGYSLKGKASIIKRSSIKPHIKKLWEDKITKRISKRFLKNIRGEKGHPKHPEALLPKIEYLIVVEVNEIIDLTPQHIKKDYYK